MLLSRSRRVSLVCGAYWLLFDSPLLHASSIDASAGTRGRYYLLESNGHRVSISCKVLSRLQSPLYGNSAKLTDAFVWALWEKALRRTQISLKFRERQSLYLVHTDSYPYRTKYVGIMSRWRSESWIVFQVRGDSDNLLALAVLDYLTEPGGLDQTFQAHSCAHTLK